MNLNLNQITISDCQRHTRAVYEPDAAAKRICIAKTYYEVKERFIYVGAAATFLNGEPLFDHDYDDRGNIDCSTLVHLILSGIPYAESPYAIGFVPEEMKETLPGKDDEFRYAAGIARYFWERERCFSEIEDVKPGDIVFYQAKEKFRDNYRKMNRFLEISHIAVVMEDGWTIMHSTGYFDKAVSEAKGSKAVALSNIGRGSAPRFYARP